MASYSIRNETKGDLIRTHQDSIMRFGETQAYKYFNSFFDYFKTIAENPFSLESVKNISAGYRRCPCDQALFILELSEILLK